MKNKLINIRSIAIIQTILGEYVRTQYDGVLTL